MTLSVYDYYASFDQGSAKSIKWFSVVANLATVMRKVLMEYLT